MDKINKNEEELRKLNFIIKVTNCQEKLNNPLTIYIRTADMSINEAIICYYNDSFITVGEKLYEKYPSLKNNVNIFLVNGKKIETNQTILYNEIFDKSIILVVQEN